jgi:peptide/nickel transport system substrate-binding protein
MAASAPRRDLLTLALAAATAGLLPPGAQAAPDKALIVAKPTDVPTLDPSFDISDVGQGMFKALYDQLTIIGPDGSVLPGLAERWEGNADATEWRFTLRGNARFHDGRPVTAEDVLFTWQRYMGNNALPPFTYAAPVAAVTAPAPDTVVFRLKAPFAPFDRHTSLISILPKHAYPVTAPAPFATAPIGSGPYRVVEWVRDDRLVLEAHGGYWAGKPPIERVIVKPLPNEHSRAAGLRSGELDIVPSLPPLAVQQLRGDSGVTVVTVPSIRTIYMGFNVKNPVLADLRLRRAVDMAIDRELIVTRLLRGLGKAEGQLVAPVTFGYDPAIRPTAYSPDQARALVKESGYDGAAILLQYPSNRWPFATEVAQAIGNFLQRVGIKVELQGMEYAAMFPLWAAQGMPGMHIFGYGPTIMDATVLLNSLINTRTVWHDDIARRLYAEQLAMTDLRQRQAKISALWARIRDQVPYAPLYNEFQAYGVRKGVNFTPRADEVVDFARVTYS